MNEHIPSWALGTLLLLACGGPPPMAPRDLEPPPPETAVPSFVSTAPAGTRLLARVPGDKIAIVLEQEQAAPLHALLVLCGIDARSDVDRIEVALSEPFGLRIDVYGRVSSDEATCAIAKLAGDHADGVVTKEMPGAIRVATSAALADGSGAPALLAKAMSEAPDRGLVIAAELDDDAVASLIVVHWDEFIELRARLPSQGAERVEAWWKSAAANVPSRILERVEVRASAGDLYLRVTPDDSLLANVALAMTLRRRVLEAFKIPSAGMAPSLLAGDHLFVDKTATRHERGALITFRFPENEQQIFIKRVIGLPGEKIEVLDGRPIIDDKLAPHCHLGRFPLAEQEAEIYVEWLGDHAYLTAHSDKPTATPCKADRDCHADQRCRASLCGRLQGPFTVRPGEAFVLGDNRDNSHDSRTWFAGRGGGVPTANTTGTARLIWWSADATGPRWDRLLIDPDTPRASYATAALAACLSQPPQR